MTLAASLDDCPTQCFRFTQSRLDVLLGIRSLANQVLRLAYLVKRQVNGVSVAHAIARCNSRPKPPNEY